MSDLFDFGFTAVDEDELEAVQQGQCCCWRCRRKAA